MIVSAISAKCPPVVCSTLNGRVNSRGGELAEKKTFNSLNTIPNETRSEDEMRKIYDSINVWKEFCHRQILNGKFDIIA